MKRFFSILFILLPWLAALAGEPYSYPKQEVRAVWLTTIGGLDWPRTYASTPSSIARQQQELRQTLDQLQRAGINMVMLQTRIRATTLYPSRYEIQDGCLSGVPGRSPGYDALAFAVAECHRRGMECHAWVVTIPVGKWTSAGCKAIRNKMPKNIVKIGPDGYMNPETQQTADYLANMCEEIVRNYNVDGIHLDYIRYPEDWPKRVNAAQARQNITRIVRTIHQRIGPIRDDVMLSCSPIGKWDDLPRYSSRGWNAYSRVYQDAQGWLREGLMDMLMPMMYFRGNHFYPFLMDWKESAEGRIIAAGLGIYFLSKQEKNWPLDEITRQMYVSRSQGVGQAFFRSRFFTENEKGIYQFAQREFYRYPALVPPLTWRNRPAPEPPQQLQVSQTAQGETLLSWQGNTPYYNIYMSDTWPVDTEKAENLILARHEGTQARIPTRGKSVRYFAICAVDRYRQESHPLQEANPHPSAEAHNMLACDGKEVLLPAETVSMAGSICCIETLQGRMVGTRNIRNHRIDVSQLADGMYILRSLGKKGNTHRLGFFIKKTRRKAQP